MVIATLPSIKHSDQPTVVLPRPHAKQRAFLTAPCKRKVIVAGRRGGKTTGAGMAAIGAALAGKVVLYVAPTSEQTSAFWRFITKRMGGLVKGKLARMHKGIRLLELWNGGYIRCKTGYNADALRGEYCDLLILDEYSIMDADVWGEVGAPMLLDNNGDAIFIFTPKRRNHAYLLYQRAQQDTKGRWGAWHFTSHDNPHLTAEALAEIVEDMDDESYQQEIMARFLDAHGAIFRNLDAVCVLDPRAPGKEPDEATTFVAGVDWALTHDFTVLTVFDAGTQEQVFLDRFRGMDYAVQRSRIAATLRHYGVEVCLSEANSMGKPNNDFLRDEGLPVVDFWTTQQTKEVIIRGLASAMDNKAVRLLADPVLYSELGSIEARQQAGGGTSYSAPGTLHDDTVIATALAVRAARRNHGFAQHTG